MSPKTGAAELSDEAVGKLEASLEELSLAIARRVERVCELDQAEAGMGLEIEGVSVREDLDRMTRWAEKLRKLIGAGKAGRPGEEPPALTAAEVGAAMDAKLAPILAKANAEYDAEQRAKEERRAEDLAAEVRSSGAAAGTPD